MATPKGLFSPNVISADIAASFPESYIIRPLEREDYHKGFFECIQVLTETGDVSEERFCERYDWMKNQGQGIHYFLVIEHQNQIVGTGTVVVERKFIRNLGNVAHIEEIAIRKEHQGKKLGLKMIQALVSVAKNVGCYKSILGCSEENEPFYIKCGFEKRGRNMGQFYDDVKPS
ncbi:acyl-CoA N-acyltransferase [Mollisia scopiformis]|uniref:Glucosamine 6-phosphate N-acetyltransferase n=1 Tax=Mollisia scopiformis TaxID=149040 RepID=A0A132BDE9_MOLSC|nr:acyl-CoA N-acyltransferase [Mollisia scopiformis]KUJ10408.1 acyl-CoA N-acyltransferase [Mollisia scopiformis]